MYSSEAPNEFLRDLRDIAFFKPQRKERESTREGRKETKFREPRERSERRASPTGAALHPSGLRLSNIFQSLSAVAR